MTSHCPFCGSGQITGRSDGGIDCAFCGQSYIVRVQPAFSGMPQAPGMGAPTDVGPDMGAMGPPGMEEGGGMPPGMEGEVPRSARRKKGKKGRPGQKRKTGKRVKKRIPRPRPGTARSPPGLPPSPSCRTCIPVPSNST